MEKAISALNKKEISWLEASQKFNVPQATLRRRCQDENKLAIGVTKTLGRPSTFLSSMEKKYLSTY